MSVNRIAAAFLFIAFGHGMARAQSEGHVIAPDTIPRYPAKGVVEITAERPSGLTVVDARSVEIKPASALLRVTGSAIAAEAFRVLSSSLNIRRYGSRLDCPSSFRGLPAEYTTVYRDGIQLTNEQLGETDLGQLTLHGISRVELIPASTAILLGGDAIGASIDLESEFANTTSLRLGTEQTGYTREGGLPEHGYYGSSPRSLYRAYRSSPTDPSTNPAEGSHSIRT